MALPFVALVLALPQLAGYVVARLWRQAGIAEWLGAVVAAYTAIWYPTGARLLNARPSPSGCGMAWFVGMVTLVVGLLSRGRSCARVQVK